jgi:hypothetical protein
LKFRILEVLIWQFLKMDVPSGKKSNTNYFEKHWTAIRRVGHSVLGTWYMLTIVRVGSLFSCFA